MPRVAVARALRRRSPLAERRLWDSIRGRKLSGLKFRRQHPIDRYFVDFACVEAMLVVELDGPFHDAQRDARRDQIIEAAGYLVLRFPNQQVLDAREIVLAEILRTAEIAGACQAPAY